MLVRGSSPHPHWTEDLLGDVFQMSSCFEVSCPGSKSQRGQTTPLLYRRCNVGLLEDVGDPGCVVESGGVGVADATSRHREGWRIDANNRLVVGSPRNRANGNNAYSSSHLI